MRFDRRIVAFRTIREAFARWLIVFIADLHRYGLEQETSYNPHNSNQKSVGP
jgi:hypothetical protein